MKRVFGLLLFATCFGGLSLGRVSAQEGAPPAPAPAPEYPPFQSVANGFEKVVSTADQRPPMYTLYKRNKDGAVLAELPPNFAQNKYFLALTVASGHVFAGLQQGDTYFYWKQYDKKLAMVVPQLDIRSTGEPESQSSVRRLFTDRVMLDVPILTYGPTGGPVIDMSSLLVGQAFRFFGPIMPASAPPFYLSTTKSAKAFPDNVELAFEVAMQGGVLRTLHYSISNVPENTGYQPRMADSRIGYFTTSYSDLGKYKDDETRVRFVNRWRLEKRDPALKLSPPKSPIVFYIEHTTPVRYRPFVKRGILAWNVAFERIGIRDAIEVQQQDAVTRDHMEKDPEDVRYNFVRWLNNDIGTAIGPSRVHPLTGEILDADIVLTDGWIRHYNNQHSEVLPQLAMENFGPGVLAWLSTRPQWDPRLLLATPAQRPQIAAKIARSSAKPYSGHPLANVDPTLLGDDEFDGLVGRHSQCNGGCRAAHYAGMDLALLRMSYELMDLTGAEGQTPAPATPTEPQGDVLDGMPEQFIGPLLSELVAHEVGHTLGLRHNFKSSSIYSLADINSNKVKGKPFAGSVMDYVPVNINMADGEIQGDYAMVGVGPYDMWAIEYGYTFATDLKPILNRVAEPELRFATDEDTIGPDPLAKRYDFSARPLDYANSQMRLAKHHREKLVEKFVKDGQSWAKARHGYELTLSMQMRAVSNMADWLGGAFVNRDKKGDANGHAPVEVVPAQDQRDALKFVIENAFVDQAFGLTPDLLKHMSADTWLDGDSFNFDEPTWPVHERIGGIQAATLTMLVNPQTLALVYDNEMRTPSDVDMLTLPELLDAISNAIYSELDTPPTEKCTTRKPWLSSLRRVLQREMLDRLVDLTMPEAGFGPAYRPISNLALQKLREIEGKIGKALANEANLDPYSSTHLAEARVRINKALDAQYIYNIKDAAGGGGGGGGFFHGDKPQPE